MKRMPVIVVIVVSLWAGAAAGATLTFAGTSLAGAAGARDALRVQIGGGNSAGANGLFGGARREVNWDGVPNAQSAPNMLPGNFFNVTSPRGMLLTTAGTGLQVSAATSSGFLPRFGTTNANYTTTFSAFTPERLFAAVGSNITDVTFALPGTIIPATVSAFGVMFSDVDTANTTSLQFFNSTGTSLGTFHALAAPGDFSFIGAAFTAGERVARVRITAGNSALGPNDGGATDVVAMDDFIYSEPQVITAAAPSAMLYAYDRNARSLLRFLAISPQTIISEIAISGLAAAEHVIGMDFHPATGQLIAVAAADGVATGRLYRIDTATGAATPLGAPAAIAVDPGAGHGIAFNPISNPIRMRVTSDANSNRRHSAEDGSLVATDTALAYVAGDASAPSNPSIAHIAYTNDQFGATGTTLYGIDTALGTLVLIGGPNGSSSPNLGQLTTIGSLGTAAATTGGFDIQPGTNIGYAALRVSPGSYLYRINLATGAATIQGLIGDTTRLINGLAVAPASACIDVDGDGSTDALTDGLLLLRALFGLTGNAAIAGTTNAGSARTTWEEIRTHLNANCGTRFGP